MYIRFNYISNEETFGIIGETPFLDSKKVEDIIKLFRFDPLHTIYSGIIKQNLSLNFKSGEFKVNHDVVDEILRQTKALSGWGRYTKALDLSSMKFTEFKYVVLLLFPAILEAPLAPWQKELFRKLTYVLKASFMPNCVYKSVCKKDLDKLWSEYLSDLQKRFGISKMSWNLHQGVHIPEIRAEHELTKFTTAIFEAFFHC